jgi:hypothetical protein
VLLLLLLCFLFVRMDKTLNLISKIQSTFFHCIFFRFLHVALTSRKQQNVSRPTVHIRSYIYNITRITNT